MDPIQPPYNSEMILSTVGSQLNTYNQVEMYDLDIRFSTAIITAHAAEEIHAMTYDSWL